MSGAATPPDLTAYISSLRERIAALRELAQNLPSGIATKLHQIRWKLTRTSYRSLRNSPLSVSNASGTHAAVGSALIKADELTLRINSRSPAWSNLTTGISTARTLQSQ